MKYLRRVPLYLVWGAVLVIGQFFFASTAGNDWPMYLWSFLWILVAIIVSEWNSDREFKRRSTLTK